MNLLWNGLRANDFVPSRGVGTRYHHTSLYWLLSGWVIWYKVRLIWVVGYLLGCIKKVRPYPICFLLMTSSYLLKQTWNKRRQVQSPPTPDRTSSRSFVLKPGNRNGNRHWNLKTRKSNLVCHKNRLPALNRLSIPVSEASCSLALQGAASDSLLLVESRACYCYCYTRNFCCALLVIKYKRRVA